MSRWLCRARIVLVAAGCLGALVSSACAGTDPYAASLQRAEMALMLGEAEDARDAYRAALAYRPDDPTALHGLARCHVARGRFEEALVAYAQLEQVRPGSLSGGARAEYDDALYRAASARMARGDPAAALRLLRRLQERVPGHAALEELLPAALIAEGGRLEVAGRSDRAEALFREALGRDPGAVDPVRSLAEALVEEGRLDTAISLLSDALLRHPEDPALRVLMDRVLAIRYPEGLGGAPGSPR